jgi:FkbM family methyltransferase
MVWEFADYERILEETRPQMAPANAIVGLAQWGRGRNRHIERTIASAFKGPLNPERPLFVFEACGLKFVGDRRDRYARTLATNPGYEDTSVSHILNGLERRPGACIDIGANMGVVAALVASKSRNRVIAVEPNLEAARRAACAFALNGLENVSLVVAAIGDHCGEATFYSSAGSSDAASLSSETLEGQLQKTTVPLLTVDALVGKLDILKVGFLKIDVEGYEPQAIAGAKDTIRRDHPDIFFEYHFEIAPKLGWTAEMVRDKLNALATYDYFVAREAEPLRPFPPTPDMGINVNVWCQAR